VRRPCRWCRRTRGRGRPRCCPSRPRGGRRCSGFREFSTLLKKVYEQGCQMAYLQTKNPKLGKFWRVLQWKMLRPFGKHTLRPFGIFCGHIVYFMVIWYIFSRVFWYVVPREIWQHCIWARFLKQWSWGVTQSSSAAQLK
jgi:hypothetical protein